MRAWPCGNLLVVPFCFMFCWSTAGRIGSCLLWSAVRNDPASAGSAQTCKFWCQPAGKWAGLELGWEVRYASRRSRSRGEKTGQTWQPLHRFDQVNDGVFFLAPCSWEQKRNHQFLSEARRFHVLKRSIPVASWTVTAQTQNCFAQAKQHLCVTSKYSNYWSPVMKKTFLGIKMWTLPEIWNPLLVCSSWGIWKFVTVTEH